MFMCCPTDVSVKSVHPRYFAGHSPLGRRSARPYLAESEITPLVLVRYTTVWQIRPDRYGVNGSQREAVFALIRELL